MPLICPQCRTPLRVADTSHLEKPFDCPECSTLLAFDADKNEVGISDAPPVEPTPSQIESPPKPVVQESFDAKLKTLTKKGLFSKGIDKFNQLLKSPLAFVWIMASVFLLMFIVLVIAPIFSQRQIEAKKLRAELDRTIQEETPLAAEESPEKKEPAKKTPDTKIPDSKSKAKTSKIKLPEAPKPEKIEVASKSEMSQPKKSNTKPEIPRNEKPLEMVPKIEEKKESEYSLPKNLNERFAQKIVRFEQKDPVSLLELLVEMEVLLGARIEPLVGNSPITEKLKKTDIQIDLKNTTVQQIFTELLKKADLEYRVGKDRIYLEAIE